MPPNVAEQPLPTVVDDVNPSPQDIDNPVGSLQELCHRENLFGPSYRFDELSKQPDEQGNFTCICCVDGQDEEVLFEAKGTGSKKKHAKKEAARGVLRCLAGQDDDGLFEARGKRSKKKPAKKRLPGESSTK